MHQKRSNPTRRHQVQHPAAHRLRRRSARQRGLSLIEVLASMALVAIIMPIALRAVSVATNASSLAAQRTQATILAQSKLDEMVITHDYNAPSQQGTFGSNWPDFAWTAQTRDFEQTVKEIELTVTWQSHAGEQAVTLTTLVFTEW